jgi:hypothetical protein
MNNSKKNNKQEGTHLFIEENLDNPIARREWIELFFADSYKDFCMHLEDKEPYIRDNSKKICEFTKNLIGDKTFHEMVGGTTDIISTHPSNHAMSKYRILKLIFNKGLQEDDLFRIISSMVDIVNIDDKNAHSILKELQSKNKDLYVSEANYFDNRHILNYENHKLRIYENTEKTVRDTFKYTTFPLKENVSIRSSRDEERRQFGAIYLYDNETNQGVRISNLIKRDLMLFYSRYMNDSEDSGNTNMKELYSFLMKNIDFTSLETEMNIDKDEVILKRMKATIITMLLKFIGDFQYIFPNDRIIFIKTVDRNLARLVGHTRNCMSMYYRSKENGGDGEISLYFPKLRSDKIDMIYKLLTMHPNVSELERVGGTRKISKNRGKNNRKMGKSRNRRRRKRQNKTRKIKRVD